LPKKDPILGEIRPGPEEVVQQLARKEKMRIKPAGAYALHRLGLTTQVPTKLVYLTDGNSRHFRLGKLEVRFKSTSLKKMSIKGKFSSLVIQSIEELGVEGISKSVESKLLGFLKQEDTKVLQDDLKLAPAKINDYIVKLLKNPLYQNDQMAPTQL
jgi:hypothetical protein